MKILHIFFVDRNMNFIEHIPSVTHFVVKVMIFKL